MSPSLLLPARRPSCGPSRQGRARGRRIAGLLVPLLPLGVGPCGRKLIRIGLPDLAGALPGLSFPLTRSRVSASPSAAPALESIEPADGGGGMPRTAWLRLRLAARVGPGRGGER